MYLFGVTLYLLPVGQLCEHFFKVLPRREETAGRHWVKSSCDWTSPLTPCRVPAPPSRWFLSPRSLQRGWEHQKPAPSTSSFHTRAETFGRRPLQTPSLSFKYVIVGVYQWADFSRVCFPSSRTLQIPSSAAVPPPGDISRRLSERLPPTARMWKHMAVPAPGGGGKVRYSDAVGAKNTSCFPGTWARRKVPVCFLTAWQVQGEVSPPPDTPPPQLTEHCWLMKTKSADLNRSDYYASELSEQDSCRTAVRFIWTFTDLPVCGCVCETACEDWKLFSDGGG